MKTITTALVGLLMLSTSASAFELGGEYFLVKDKTIVALQLGGQLNPSLAISADLGLANANSNESDQGAAGSYLGTIFSLQLFHNQPVGEGLELRLGGGFDYWSLHGIHADESMGGLTFNSELRGQITPTSKFFISSRYYVIRSDGLRPGEDRDGNESIPLILSGGVVWSFK